MVQILFPSIIHILKPISFSQLLSAHSFPSLALYPHGATEAFVFAVPYANVSDISVFYQPHIRSIQVLQQIGRCTCDSHHNFAAIQGIGCEINCLIFCTLWEGVLSRPHPLEWRRGRDEHQS